MAKKYLSTDIANQDTWVKRLEELFETKGSKRSDLAKSLDVSKGTITGWFAGTKGGPVTATFAAIADYYGVSLDYLWGRAVCEKPDNEEIHKVTGLSDKAINALKHTCDKVSSGEVTDEKKLAICNYLIETMHESSFFEDLYNYLFGKFYFENSVNDSRQGAAFIISKSPGGKENRSLVLNSVFSHAHLSMVYRDLSRMKDEVEKMMDIKEKENYEIWKNSEESKAIDEEFWIMADAEEQENEHE